MYYSSQCDNLKMQRFSTYSGIIFRERDGEALGSPEYTSLQEVCGIDGEVTIINPSMQA